MRMFESGVEIQTERDKKGGEFGSQDQLLAIDFVSKHAAVKSKDHERDDFDRAHRANGYIGISNYFDLEGEGDISDHRPQGADKARRPEIAKIPIGAKRGEIDRKFLAHSGILIARINGKFDLLPEIAQMPHLSTIL